MEVNQLTYSEAQKRASAKYNSKAYDELKIRVPKGNREIIKKYVDDNNERSVNDLINKLLEQQIPELKKNE